MARRGENIYKRKDGRWEGRYIKDRDLNNKAIYGFVYAKTYSEVKEKLLSSKKNISNETNDLTLSYIALIWLNNTKSKIKHSSYVKYFNIVYNHILPDIGDISFRNITNATISKFIENKLLYGNLNKQCGLSTKTVKDIISVLKLIIKYASSQGFNVVCSFDSISIKTKQPQPAAYNFRDNKKLISYLTKNINYTNLGLLLTIFTGIRIGELCALKFSDILIAEKALLINKTMQRIQTLTQDNKKTSVTITPPKSECSIRKVPVPDFIIDIIIKNAMYIENAYVLTGDVTTFIEPRTMENKFNSIIKDCGLKKTNFHSLRHSFATKCIEAGVDVKSLSEILGHSSVNITLNRYVHPSEEIKRINMEKYYSYLSVSPSII